MPCWSRTIPGRLTFHIESSGVLNSSSQCALPQRKILPALVGFGGTQADVGCGSAVGGAEGAGWIDTAASMAALPRQAVITRTNRTCDM